MYTRSIPKVRRSRRLDAKDVRAAKRDAPPRGSGERCKLSQRAQSSSPTQRFVLFRAIKRILERKNV